jgi:hypothetical protein
MIFMDMVQNRGDKDVCMLCRDTIAVEGGDGDRTISSWIRGEGWAQECEGRNHEMCIADRESTKEGDKVC